MLVLSYRKCPKDKTFCRSLSERAIDHALSCLSQEPPTYSVLLADLEPAVSLWPNGSSPENIQERCWFDLMISPRAFLPYLHKMRRSPATARKLLFRVHHSWRSSGQPDHHNAAASFAKCYKLPASQAKFCACCPSSVSGLAVSEILV